MGSSRTQDLQEREEEKEGEGGRQKNRDELASPSHHPFSSTILDLLLKLCDGFDELEKFGMDRDEAIDDRGRWWCSRIDRCGGEGAWLGHRPVCMYIEEYQRDATLCCAVPCRVTDDDVLPRLKVEGWQRENGETGNKEATIQHAHLTNWGVQLHVTALRSGGRGKRVKRSARCEMGECS